MKTIVAGAFALVVALSGVSGVSTAWAAGSRPVVSPHHGGGWKSWPSHGHGHFRGGFHGRPHFQGHGGRGVIVAPGRPVVVPGYWAWNGYGWVWVPAYWRR